MQWQSVAVDGGSGRRPSEQEVETVRRKSDAQSPEIRVGVLAKIFDFFRFSNLFLANANQPTPLASSTVPSLLQDKFAESSKGHFLCCETKLVTSRKKLSRVASKMPAYSDPQNKITSSITLFWPPGGWSLAQLVGWLWLTCFLQQKSEKAETWLKLATLSMKMTGNSSLVLYPRYTLGHFLSKAPCTKLYFFCKIATP